MMRPRIAESIGEKNWLKLFASNATSVRALRWAIRELGFDQHPEVIKLQNIRGVVNGHQHRRALVRILFHVDGPTLFQDFDSMVDDDDNNGAGDSSDPLASGDGGSVGGKDKVGGGGPGAPDVGGEGDVSGASIGHVLNT
jgi:hypothetical protein